jgi:hypothetical protein
MFSNLETLQTEIIFIADFAGLNRAGFTMQRPQARAFLKYQGARSFRNTPTPKDPILTA